MAAGIRGGRFMSAMIGALASDYNIDTQRVYASGYSLGGSIVYDMAAYLPDQVAVIAPVAANMWEWTLSDVNWTTPIACVHILGTNDFYAPYNGNAYSISTSAQNAHFVALNGAETTPTSENLGGNITRYTWAAGEACHGHQHYVRQGGGHDEPSDYPNGPEWIWDYASQYSLDGLIECVGGCEGDFNGDGTRDVNDILTAIGAFGNGDGGDIDGDGDTDVSDILALLGLFGQDC